MTCYQRVGTHTWTQEWYETQSRDAAARARELRKNNYHVTVSGMGMQVTPVGRIKMTLVSVQHPNGDPPPWPERYQPM